MTGGKVMFTRICLILLIHLLVFRIVESRRMKCEELTIPLCQGLGYNTTYMPNRFNHESQKEAALEVHQFWPLVEINCSKVLRFFLCSVYSPVCDKIYGKELLPCRSVCDHAKKGCISIMQEYGFKWPKKIECHLWPEQKEGSLCMAPNGDMSLPTAWPTMDKSRPFSGRGPSLSPDDRKQPTDTAGNKVSFPSVKKSGLGCECICQTPFMSTDHTLKRDIAKVEDCALPCNATYFTSDQEKFATTWVTLWSTLCFVSTFLTLATFFLDTERFGYPERPVIFLSGCYLLLSFGYILRLIAGKQAVICDENKLITQETTGPAMCTIVFILTYFGGMASALWWVILAFTWFLAAGLKWSNESISNVSQYFHIVAWLIPSVQTISVLAMASIDGDSLSGICHTGNQSKESLIVFVIVPLGIYLTLGTSFLVAGFVSLFRIRNTMRNEGNSTNKLEKLMVRIGVFSVLYTVPATVTIGCYLYEMTNREKWQESITCAHCRGDGERSEPDFSAFMVRYFMSLVVGISTGFWICSMKTVDSWRTLGQRLSKNKLAGKARKDGIETTSLRPTAIGAEV